jgi:hypothetical protein
MGCGCLDGRLNGFVKSPLPPCPSSFCLLAGVVFLGMASALPAGAEDVLFIGNSFTMGSPATALVKNGGVPELVEEIAIAKHKSIDATMLAVKGKDWGYHLKQPQTAEALGSRKWDCVVLQDHSIKPTHLGKLEDHLANAGAFYKRILSSNTGAKVVLFETWAYANDNAIYTGKSGPKSFADPGEMNGEVQKGYGEARRLVEAIDSGDQVAIAPVGTAFARCRETYPEIDLNSKDRKHASVDGSYLAALVLYSTLTKDSPMGATSKFEKVAIDPGVAEKLQKVAASVTASSRGE